MYVVPVSMDVPDRCSRYLLSGNHPSLAGLLWGEKTSSYRRRRKKGSLFWVIHGTLVACIPNKTKDDSMDGF